MAMHTLSNRERHLLALRWAVPILIGGACACALMLPLPFTDVSNASGLIGFGFAVAAFFGIAYCLRYFQPSKDRQIEPNQVVGRPRYAWRAGLGAMLGMSGLVASMVWSFNIGPFSSARGRNDLLLVGGAAAGVILGLLVYLFSAVIYMRVTPSKSDLTEDLRIRLGFLVLFLWVMGVAQEANKHSFLQALGKESWLTITLVVSVIFGWTIYIKFVPEAPNPFDKRGPESIATPSDGT
jgi:hypothetical protein